MVAKQDDPRLRAAAVRSRAHHRDRRDQGRQPAAARTPHAVPGPHEADIRDVVLRNQTGDDETALGLCGRIELAVDAFDTPPMPVPGKFRGLPVAPALVRWNIAPAERHSASSRGAPPPTSALSGSTILLRPSCRNHPIWCRTINLIPITYAFRPRLRDRLTLGRLT